MSLLAASSAIGIDLATVGGRYLNRLLKFSLGMQTTLRWLDAPESTWKQPVSPSLVGTVAQATALWSIFLVGISWQWLPWSYYCLSSSVLPASCS